MTLRAGDKIDRYSIVSVLGTGGMGEVYRASDERLRRHVALKVLRFDKYGPSAQTVGRLLREARAAAALEHPNVVAIYDVAEASSPEALAGTPYIAMEFVDGQSLRAFIGDAKVPIAQRVRWLVDVARALSAAHRAGLVHRDIKPENVMVRVDGTLKVLDFGITQRIDSRAAPSLTTSSQTDDALGASAFGGTPSYMSPEQLGGEPLDGRTDQFAWGVMAYELLSGAVPWRARASSVQLVAEIMSRYPEPIGARVADVPPAVAAAVMRALAKSREHRFATMDELVASLETRPPEVGAAGRDSSAPSAVTQDDAEKPSLRRSVALGAMMLLTVALVAWGSRLVVHPAAAPASSAAPSSTNAEASALYAAGLQAERDGSTEVARASYDRAAKLDPSFAAAHLRSLALVFYASAAEREHFKSTLLLRARLNEEDRALLDAYEPIFRATPDLAEAERRLARAASLYASDPLVAMMLVRHRIRRGDYAAALETCDQALARDPELATAWFYKATTLLRLDRVDEGYRAYGECLRVSPRATSCLRHLSELDAQEGRCEEAERLSRELISADPDSPRWFLHLARSMYGRTQSVDAARAALVQKWARTQENERAQTEIEDRFYLDILEGSFDRAIDHARQWEETLAASSEEREHQRAARNALLLYEELGDRAKVAQIAQEFLAARGAWTLDAALDFRFVAFTTRYRAGAVSRAQLVQDRDAWLADSERRSQGTPAQRWVLAYGESVRTKDDAVEALRALPKDHPLEDAMSRDIETYAIHGYVRALAGDIDDALPFLTRAARSCTAIHAPFWQTQANLHFGEALEAKGDSKGACAAYAVVLARWGREPRSVSAKEARARFDALHCE